MVKYDVSVAENGSLGIARLNEPHGEPDEDSYQWYYSSDEVYEEKYKTFVIGRHYARRSELKALVQQKWQREYDQQMILRNKERELELDRELNRQK